MRRRGSTLLLPLGTVAFALYGLHLARRDRADEEPRADLEPARSRPAAETPIVEALEERARPEVSRSASAEPYPPPTGSPRLFRGRVLDRAGRPVGGATVDLSAWCDEASSPISTLSSPDGRFLLPAPGPRATLRVRASGHVEAEVPLRAGAGEAAIELSRAASLLVRVVDRATGGAIPGASVELEREGQGIVAHGSAALPSGTWSRDGLPPGAYRVRALGSPGGAPGAVAVALREGESARIELRLDRPAARPILGTATLAGRVRRGDTSLAGALVRIGDRALRTDPAGCFVAEGISAGSAIVSVVHDGATWSRPIRVPEHGTGVIEIDLADSDLSKAH